MRITFIAILAALLSACAGVGAFVPETETSYPSVQDSYKGSVTRTKADVAKQWWLERAERNVTRVADGEIWTYKYDNNWCGALLVVVPLMLPVCTHADLKGKV
ncbi:hypothetical protein ACSTAY_04895 [Vreelandella alkaliphila]